MDLASVFINLGSTTYAAVNRTPGGYDGHGRTLPPTEASITTTGHMQPLSGREVQRLPEGLHAKELRAYYTADALTIADHDAGTSGVHITTPEGTVWEVVSAEDWGLFGYRRYILSRVDL